MAMWPTCQPIKIKNIKENFYGMTGAKIFFYKLAPWPSQMRRNHLEWVKSGTKINIGSMAITLFSVM
jgi:hypothetical protein